MKNIKKSLLLLVVIALIFIVSGYTNSEKEEAISVLDTTEHQMINLFVTHGHCSTPFSGIVDDLKVTISPRAVQGNPLENMEIKFAVDPDSFNVCVAEELTERIKTPGLFSDGFNDKITFKSTNVYTMGMDWYQINGILSIKGVAKEIKLFATGISAPNSTKTTTLVLEGQMDLFDWGIDYDLIVNGRFNTTPTKMMHINMKIDLS